MTKFKELPTNKKIKVIAGASIIFCEIFFLGMIGGSLIDFNFEEIVDDYITNPILESMEQEPIPQVVYSDYENTLMQTYTPHQLKVLVDSGEIDIESFTPDFRMLYDAQTKDNYDVISNPKTGGIVVIPR